MRNVLSKLAMNKPQGENMTAANMFGVLTCISAVVSLPFALLVEGRALRAAWTSAAPTYSAGLSLLGKIGLTGLYFYGYSEVAMKALNNVHPVTHAIGNTLRRVIIMVICMLVFRTPMSVLGATGSFFAIAGSYNYAIVKTQEKREELKKRAEQAVPAAEELKTKIAEALPLQVSAAGERAA